MLRNLERVTMMVAAALFVAANAIAPAHTWERITPVDAGFAPDVTERLDERFERGDFGKLHGVVVVRYGKLVLERYYAGPDERWGSPLGNVAFTADTRHDLRSVTKSITSLLYGIALSDGVVPPLGAAVVDSFPEYSEITADPARRSITIEHMLTMTAGLKWNEELPYSDPNNSEVAMELADDRFEFILGRPLVASAGAQWTYSGGTTAVLGHLIEKGSGLGLLAYAREKLFRPLGIEDVEWVNGYDRRASAASGLRMRPRDLARIGQLILDKGRAGGKQIVPQEWLAASLERRAEVTDDLHYGYQWWLGDMPDTGDPWFAGIGYGGQRLIIVPSEAVVVVIMAGNYGAPDTPELARAVTSGVLLPAMTSRR